MCGRFGLNYPRSTLQDWYGVSAMPEIEPRYNIAPTTNVLVVRDGESGRMGSLMHWGLIPYWAKDTKRLPIMNNARAETVAEKPLFKQSFRRRRCIIPASGFYEWQAQGKGKLPYFIYSRDGAPFSFAGIWGTWTATDTGESIDSCAIITTTPNALMETIHDRMPVILAREEWEAWLDPDYKADDSLLAMLKPYNAERMQAWPVSSVVGRVTNQGEQLFQPLVQ